jgi:HPt (histidine-containing phosphotransfer) domain-containing protein
MTTLSLNIDLSYLDMMTDGDTDMKQTMLEMLLEEIPQEVEKLRDCAKNADWKNLNEVSHKFKSTLSYIGSEVMNEANLKIEHASKTNENFEDLNRQLTILEQNAPLVLQDLKSVLDTL